MARHWSMVDQNRRHGAYRRPPGSEADGGEHLQWDKCVCGGGADPCSSDVCHKSVVDSCRSGIRIGFRFSSIRTWRFPEEDGSLRKRESDCLPGLLKSSVDAPVGVSGHRAGQSPAWIPEAGWLDSVHSPCHVLEQEADQGAERFSWRPRRVLRGLCERGDKSRHVAAEVLGCASYVQAQSGAGLKPVDGVTPELTP